MFETIAQNIPDQQISFHDITLIIRRLDLVHPQISGNKFFKLKYNFLEAKRQGYQHILSFGGAYSNHIAATAFAAQQFGFQSVGVIRGEELADRPLNPTLATAQQFGMQLHFVSRDEYRRKQRPEYLAELARHFPEHYVIPEGGTNALAIRGCQEILKENDAKFDVICCAVGTGGTITGLIKASYTHQKVLGFSALKGSFLEDEIAQLTKKTNWNILDDYCCGGYAKTSAALMQFIRDFEAEFSIPLEQIYTAKMLMGIFDLIEKNYFPAGSKLLVIHSGGLQGRNISFDSITT
ncbi:MULTISPECIES: 1-aminocyclopropane-1-carboxylate deaminase/D-cysteine desulfhydrase [Acinetobacter]|uniref:D-cysteine desulfhydrase n=1 Tax=Acinetobacter lwoffii TaxID=28090 RepID=A0AAW3VC81_ACILW|nr:MULTISPECIES: pyridoxal-phosphate dependent enzyme [Acinetobacter]MBB6362200.1 D-cysteine desulfhydrase [Acinetobacter lwoffii]MEB6678816.1 pyridoxal-phosphate dependent enzyme [Acinetobacter lwoffii]